MLSLLSWMFVVLKIFLEMRVPHDSPLKVPWSSEGSQYMALHAIWCTIDITNLFLGATLNITHRQFMAPIYVTQRLLILRHVKLYSNSAVSPT